MKHHQHHSIEQPPFSPEHHESVKDAILCHLPYAIFSVALSLIVLGILTLGLQDRGHAVWHAKKLFHIFHFTHILFAATGVVLALRQYVKTWWTTILIGTTVPLVFCTVSDAVIPFVGGKFLGVSSSFHWCALSHFGTVFPFLAIGILNGVVLSSHPTSRYLYYSLGSHFVHIFISSLASTFYLVGHGLSKWWDSLGFLFFILIIAVVIPCTLADLVVPMFFGKTLRGSEEATGSSCCTLQDKK